MPIWQKIAVFLGKAKMKTQGKMKNDRITRLA
jgi:hypothetical protein